ncbi:hypothetical protein IMSAG249_00245 [Lachnospiraceae bacterium]|nr:hypothetical protein IMSAG249_00245 [Lachnospiraceae bacterium]
MSPLLRLQLKPLKNMKRAVGRPCKSITSFLSPATASLCRSITTSMVGFSSRIFSMAGRDLLYASSLTVSYSSV